MHHEKEGVFCFGFRASGSASPFANKGLGFRVGVYSQKNPSEVFLLFLVRAYRVPLRCSFGHPVWGTMSDILFILCDVLSPEGFPYRGGGGGGSINRGPQTRHQHI